MSYEEQIYAIYKEIREGIPDHNIIRKVFLSVLKDCKKRYEEVEG